MKSIKIFLIKNAVPRMMKDDIALSWYLISNRFSDTNYPVLTLIQCILSFTISTEQSGIRVIFLSFTLDYIINNPQRDL